MSWCVFITPSARVVLYNDNCYGFWARFRWPRVFWQAVTLWLVNRGMTVRPGRPVEQMCNRRETTWYENYAIRFYTVSSVRFESRVRDTKAIRGVRSSLTIRLARRCKHWHPRAIGRRYGARRIPLSEYISLNLSLKLTTNCVLLSWIKWEIYFYKEVCFVRSLNFVNHVGLLYKCRIWHKANFPVEFNMFEFRVCFLQDWLPYQGFKDLSVVPVIDNWRKNKWIPTFPKYIFAMWNANRPFRVFNTGNRAHLPRPELLRRKLIFLWVCDVTLVVIFLHSKLFTQSTVGL